MKTVIVQILIIVLAVSLGYWIGNNYHKHTEEMHEQHDIHTTQHEMSPSHHSHSTLDIPAHLPIPTLDITAHPYPKSGYNLQVAVTNFLFSPENASTTHIDGQWHAHLYIDNKKITRLYSEWTHIPAEWLTSGTHDITVGLSANDHSELVSGWKAIADTVTIVVPE